MNAPRRKPTAQQHPLKYDAATLEKMRAMWEETEMTAEQIGEQFGGIGKNVIIGQAHRRGWRSRQRFADNVPFKTFAERIDTLHANLDRVLAETRDVGRIADRRANDG